MKFELMKKFISFFIALLIVLMPISHVDALTISNVAFSEGTDSASISWTTDEPSTSLVNYGLFKDALGQSTGYSDMVTEHNVNLFGLTEDRNYYFEIESVNISNDKVIDNNNGAQYSFRTKDSTAPPRVSGLKQDGKDENSITVKWDNIDIDDFVEYVVFRDDVNIANSTLATYTDSGLSLDTAYSYKVAAVDTSGNVGLSSVTIQIRTLAPDYAAPIINNVSIVELRVDGAKIMWKTDEDASSVIYYGLNANVGNKIEKNESVKEHLASLDNLIDKTPYYYKVVSCDSNDNCAETAVANFITGVDTEPPFIEADLPEWYNSNRLDISGKTEGFSKVKVYVNNELKRALTADITGDFKFTAVGLDTLLEKNKVKLVAIDQIGFENFIEKEISLDTEPPILNATVFGKYTHEQHVVIEGTVSEEVTLDINAVSGSQKLEFMPKVTGLRMVRLNGNSVELEWDKIENDNLAGYIIYRDGKRIISYPENYFTDPVLNKSKQYTYQVAAYDYTCVEGEKSELLTISTPNDAASLDDSKEELNSYCDIPVTGSAAMTVSGKFSQSVQLVEGSNVVTINATDKAGNSAIIQQETILDMEKPVILDTNIASLNPSYVRQVTVKGTVTKKAGQEVIVIVSVNDKDYSDLANEDGTFSVNVKLEKTVQEEMNEGVDYDPEKRTSNYFASYSGGWFNKIKIIARSESGLESDPYIPPGDGIMLTSCGYGSWWSVQLGEPTPTILTPRLMLEGYAQIGIPVLDIKWQGGSFNASLNNVRVTNKVDLSNEDKKLYDLDWIRDVQYIKNNADLSKGYVMVKFKKLDSGSLFTDSEEAEEGRSEDNLTTLEMENYLADNRLEDDNCLVPGFGCVRIPLMMELDFSYNEDVPTFANQDRQEIDTRMQKQCWDVEIAIDRRLPSDKIPEAFLRASINLLNATITAIDEILVPLNTVKEVLFYGCAGSMLIDFIMAFQESFNCEFSSTLSVFTMDGGKFDEYWARTGQCKDEYLDNDENEKKKRDACLKCEEAIRARKNFEQTMKWVCDRIFCPSAPTYQRYVRDMSTKYMAERFWNDKKPVYRSDCSFKLPKDSKTTSALNKYLTYEEINIAYELYDEQKSSESNECEGLHEPNNDCCMAEYMEQWDSACLIMDEAKESKCVALDESEGSFNDDSDCSSLGKLWNSLADPCAFDAGGDAEIIRVDDTFKGSTKSVLDRKNPYIAGENEVWFRLVSKETGQNEFSGDATPGVRRAEIGYITDDISGAQTEVIVGQSSKVSTQRVFQPKGTGVYNIHLATTDENAKEYDEGVEKEFVTKYKGATGSGDSKAKEVYHFLQETIGVSDKDYIVDPTSGILRSFQCMCLPGITSYLNLWKKVMEAVKLCFETILVTGDGSAGMCKAVLSVYVCDLIYDLISCAKHKWGPGYKREESGSIGNFFASLTSAGSKISDSVTTRYGDSTVWKSLFAERKLVHAVCLWAFTGTWDFDVNAILEEDVSIDVQTIAFMYPCERRFVSFNPSSNPSGLTTYNYHLGYGMVAGSDISYQVELVCSADYSCDSPDGRCDCAGSKGEQKYMIPLAGTGTAKRGDTIGGEEGELFENLRDAPYRYDKAVISWSSHDSDKSGKVECKIKETGGSPPVFCQLDAAEGRYRCEFGFDDEEYIRFDEEPKPLKNVYYADDNENPINVRLKLAQKQPQDVENYAGKEINPYTKFMQMKLYNGAKSSGAVEIDDPVFKKYYAFNGNGIHERDDLPNYVIKKDDFLKTSDSFKVNPSSLVKNYRIPDSDKPPQYHNVIIELSGSNTFRVRNTITNSIIQAPIQITDGNIIYYDNYIIELKARAEDGQKITVIYNPVGVPAPPLYLRYVGGGWKETVTTQGPTQITNWKFEEGVWKWGQDRSEWKDIGDNSAVNSVASLSQAQKDLLNRVSSEKPIPDKWVRATPRNESVSSRPQKVEMWFQIWGNSGNACEVDWWYNKGGSEGWTHRGDSCESGNTNTDVKEYIIEESKDDLDTDPVKYGTSLPNNGRWSQLPGMHESDGEIDTDADKTYFRNWFNNKVTELKNWQNELDKRVNVEGLTRDNSALSLLSIYDETNVIYSYAQSSSGVGCTTNLQQWDLELTFYNKNPDDIDDISGQIATYQGKPVQRTVKVPVKCERSSDEGGLACAPNSKVLQPCKCGTKICKPATEQGEAEYCNFYGPEGRCEPKVGGSQGTVPAGNFREGPSIGKIVIDRGTSGSVTIESNQQNQEFTVSKIVNGVSAEITDNGNVNTAVFIVGNGLWVMSKQGSTNTYKTNQIEFIELGTLNASIEATDNENIKGSFEFKVKVVQIPQSTSS